MAIYQATHYVAAHKSNDILYIYIYITFNITVCYIQYPLLFYLTARAFNLEGQE